ncbi:MAG: hypothetical protein CME65_01205 [Halobacteriovoraceae bacterium]|nr:hypothetical protein [Halobacteriovoraceae bacterium]|tara:strand:- start:2025 stop:2432 length:408 start_codon:yes stop_codon:yes gene_type:complete
MIKLLIDMLPKALLLLILALPFSAKADSNPKIKSLMKDYLIALGTKDKKKLTNICSSKYIKLLQKNGTLDKTFEQQKPFDQNKIEFDIKIQKAGRTPNKYFVNIKDKKDSHYGEHWYVVNLEKDKFLIDDMVFFD